MREIALDPNHKDQTRVLLWVHGMLGFSPKFKAEIKQQIEVTTNFYRTAALAELRQMEREMGVQLLPQPEPVRMSR